MDFKRLSKFFQEVRWKTLYKETSLEEKWKVLMEIHNERVYKYVPRQKQEKMYITCWLTRRCNEANEKRDEAWN